MTQTEESYISAGELGRLSGLRPELVLNTELPLLQGLKFDLAVTSPYRAVDGFLEVRGVPGAPQSCGASSCQGWRTAGVRVGFFRDQSLQQPCARL